MRQNKNGKRGTDPFNPFLFFHSRFCPKARPSAKFKERQNKKRGDLAENFSFFAPKAYMNTPRGRKRKK